MPLVRLGGRRQSARFTDAMDVLIVRAVGLGDRQHGGVLAQAVARFSESPRSGTKKLDLGTPIGLHTRGDSRARGDIGSARGLSP